MRELDHNELEMIAGGGEHQGYYNLGAGAAKAVNALRDGYDWAVSKTTDLFEYLLS